MGFSGADLFQLINESTIKAVIEGTGGFEPIQPITNQSINQFSSFMVNLGITNEILDWAKDKIMMGSERKSAIIPERVLSFVFM